MDAQEHPSPDEIAPRSHPINEVKMRQIKVKVWDKKTNIMLQAIELKQLLSYLVFQNCPNSDAYNLMKDHFKDLVWLESTGKKDENGNEIYDGDIVKCGKLLQKVYYDIEDVAFKVKCVNCHDEYGSLFKYWKGEVVGNIYENPELLPKDAHDSSKP